MPITHAFASPKADGANDTLVRPSDWNADHIDSSVYDVTRYGASGDNVNDDTTAIQAAITACPSGGVVFFPPGYYKFSSLSIINAITLRGGGWFGPHQAAFGDSGWLEPGNFGGSVLMSTATSGAAITFDEIGSKFDVIDLRLIGPGTGTSTGIKWGTAVDYTIRNQWRNVHVANFALGFDCHFSMDSTYIDLRTMGCKTGFALSEFCNQNVWINTEIQFSSVDSITLAVGGPNMFYGGLLQNISGTSGLRTTNSSCEFAVFDGWYFEASTATNTVNFASGAHHSLTNFHFSSDGGNVSVGADNCLIGWGRRAGSNTLTITGTENMNINSGLVPTDSGTRTQTWRPALGLTTSGVFIKPGVFTTAARPSATTSGAGAIVYDSTLGKPIFSNGTNWTDAAGTVV